MIHVFHLKNDGETEFFYRLLYVEDMLLVGHNYVTLNFIKEKLKSKFEMKDLGLARNMEIERDRINGKLFLTQKSYIERVVKRFFVYDAKPISLPLSTCVNLTIDQLPKLKMNLKE